MTDEEIEAVVRALVEAEFSHLQYRVCSAPLPMPDADKDRFRWYHPDAVETGRFFNLETATCPHCRLSFSCLPRHWHQ